MSERSERLSRVSLKIRFGELTLGALNRRMILRPTNPFAGAEDQSWLGDALQSIPDEADGVLIPSMRVVSPLPKLNFNGSWIRYVPRQYDRHYADLSTSYEVYLDCFSSKSRSSLRRKARKLEEHSGGTIHWKCYKNPDEIREFYRLARDISRQSYQERLLDAGLPEDQTFQSAMFESAKQGCVRGYLIFLDNAPVAYLYCPVQEGIVRYAYLGFLEEFGKWSPGTVLLWLVMEDLFREGTHRVFDFTEGGDRDQHSQKRLFSTGSIQCTDVYFFRRTFRNLLAVVTHATADWVSASMGSALESVGLKRVVRSWTRRVFHR